jgi:endonuclease G
MSRKVLIAVLILSSQCLAQTLTPFPAGQRVEITTTTNQVHVGTLQNRQAEGWITFVPDGTSQPVYIQASWVLYVRPAPGTPVPTPAPAPTATTWKLRSKHFCHGFPVPSDDRYNFTPQGETETQPGISILIREGFTVGHCDRFKVPLWVSMRWTEDDFDESENALPYGRPFAEDEELPAYARAGTDYDFSASQMDRGDMARHQDNAAWGQDNSEAACLMSNIAPRHMNMNRGDWLDLENAHRNIVDTNANIDTIWVISGTVFMNMTPQSMVGNNIGVPYGTYKVIGWYDQNDQFNARGYVLRQTDQGNPSTHYLTRIDDIEQMTGLDFFPELDEATEQIIEAATYTTMW